MNRNRIISGLLVGTACLALPSGAQADPTPPCNSALDAFTTECGANSTALGPNSTAIGAGATADASDFEQSGATAVGANSLADGHKTTAIGQNARAEASESTAVGADTNIGALATGATALGYNITVAGAGAIGIGGGISLNSTSTNSIAIGNVVEVTAPNSIAIGAGTVINGDNSVVIGTGAATNASRSFVGGVGNGVIANSSVAIGDSNQIAFIAGTGAVGIGRSNFSQGVGAVALGDDNDADGLGSVALGNASKATGVSAVAMGDAAIAKTDGSIAIGDGARANAVGVFGVSGANGVAMGTAANAQGDRSVSIGANSSSTGVNSVALGAGSQATVDNVVSVGAVGSERKIVNVANGLIAINSKEAVNGGQLFNTQTLVDQLLQDALQWNASLNAYDARHGTASPQRITNVAAGAVNATSTDAINGSQLNAVKAVADNSVQYDDATKASVTLGGVGSSTPVALRNVAPGIISATSTDAVNGAQLNATNQGITTLGDILGDQITLINNGGSGPVQYTSQASPLTPNGGVPSHDLMLVSGAPNGAVRLHNVAAGVVNATSTDAVNGSQLNNVQTQVTTIGGTVINHGTRIINLEGDVNTLKSDALLWNGTLGAFDATHAGVGPQRITSVAAGAVNATSTDAINGSQLFAVQQEADQTAVKYDKIDTDGDGVADTVNYDSVTLAGGANGTTVRNVAAGAVTATSTDAVNGSQLFAVDQKVQNALLYDATLLGGVGAFDASRGGVAKTITNVADGAVNATSSDAINGSQLFAVQQQADLTAVKYDMIDTDGDGVPDTVNYDSVTLAGGANGTTVRNVADGTLSDTSTEAVNGSQLYATNQIVDDHSIRIGDIEGDLSIIGPRIDIMEGDVNTLKQNALLWNPALNGGVGAYDASHVGSNGVASNQIITNVAAGAVNSTSTDAVNGSQLSAVQDQVTNLGDQVTNLGDQVTNLGDRVDIVEGSIGAIQGDITNINNELGDLQRDALQWDDNLGAYSASHTDANGNVSTTNVISNVAEGVADTDAVNLGQLKEYTAGSANAVTYDNSSHDIITLGGPNGTTITNVAGGSVTEGSTDAINGGQLYEVTQQIANGGIGPVQYSNPGSPTVPNGGVKTNDLTLVGADTNAPVVLHNVADGVLNNDAVNVGQLNKAIDGVVDEAVSIANNYTDNRFNELSGDINKVARDSRSGVASAMAIAALPQPLSAGGTLISMGGGYYRSQGALAIGISHAPSSGKGVIKFGLTVDTTEHWGLNGGFGIQF